MHVLFWLPSLFLRRVVRIEHWWHAWLFWHPTYSILTALFTCIGLWQWEGQLELAWPDDGKDEDYGILNDILVFHRCAIIQFLDPDFWTLISGPWFLDPDFWTPISGPQFLDPDFWTPISGPQFLDPDFWTPISGPWFLDPDFWTPISGPRFLDPNFWTPISGPQFLDPNFWTPISGPRFLDLDFWTSILPFIVFFLECNKEIVVF